MRMLRMDVAKRRVDNELNLKETVFANVMV